MRPNRIMIHGIRDILLAALDHARRVLRQPKFDVHVVDVGAGVHGHLVPGELPLIVQFGPGLALGG